MYRKARRYNSEPRRTQKTGWNALASWYVGWAGSGSKFHKKFGIPQVVSHLHLSRGMTFLDVGCGVGALYEAVKAKKVDYIGIDKSERMIQQAKKQFGDTESFYVADAANKTGIQLPRQVEGKFDRAAFLFSIQDIDDEKVAIKNVSKLLRSKGELVIFMLHPSFRIPRMSGWGKDPKRKVTFRRVDLYKTRKVIPLPQKTGQGNVTSFFYHSPFEDYLNALAQSGLMLLETEAVYSTDKPPEGEFPHFLVLRAKKV